MSDVRARRMRLVSAALLASALCLLALALAVPRLAEWQLRQQLSAFGSLNLLPGLLQERPEGLRFGRVLAVAASLGTIVAAFVLPRDRAWGAMLVFGSLLALLVSAVLSVLRSAQGVSAAMGPSLLVVWWLLLFVACLGPRMKSKAP
jgi:hypothetical protein